MKNKKGSVVVWMVLLIMIVSVMGYAIWMQLLHIQKNNVMMLQEEQEYLTARGVAEVITGEVLNWDTDMGDDGSLGYALDSISSGSKKLKLGELPEGFNQDITVVTHRDSATKMRITVTVNGYGSAGMVYTTYLVKQVIPVETEPPSETVPGTGESTEEKKELPKCWRVSGHDYK